MRTEGQSAWRQIESTFLGVTRPAFQDRAADAGWARDPVTEFCPRCATSTGVHEATAAGCTRCSALKLPWDRAVRLGRYEGLLRACIQEVKFSAWRRLGIDLGREMGRQLEPLLAGVDRAQVVLVPVPAPFWRRISRGIDHTGAITCGVHQVIGGTVARAISRKHRRTQVGLSHTDRQRNAAGSMAVRGRPRFEGCTILLVDDIRTTGATMGEAAKVVRRGLKERGQVPAAIWSCTLAVAEVGDAPGP
jgi:ComF family protein